MHQLQPPCARGGLSPGHAGRRLRGGCALVLTFLVGANRGWSPPKRRAAPRKNWRGHRVPQRVEAWFFDDGGAFGAGQLIKRSRAEPASTLYYIGKRSIVKSLDGLELFFPTQPFERRITSAVGAWIPRFLGSSAAAGSLRRGDHRPADSHSSSTFRATQE
jgi:hypothetical protein